MNIIIAQDEGCDKVFVDKRIDRMEYSVNVLHHFVWSMNDDKLIR